MDLDLDINGDLQVTGNGDFKTVTGWDEVRQAVLRLLFTNPREVLADGTRVYADYVFSPDWGLGIPRMAGQPFGADFKAKFTQKVREAVLGQEGVDSSKDPLIEYFQHGRAIYTRITAYMLNNEQKAIVFPVKQN